MFRLAVWLCLATRARGDGLLVLTSPGYAAVGVGEALVFEVVDASGAAAAPVVRVGGEVAEALRSARPLADNATAWTFRLFLELGAHTVEACAGRCVSMIARVVRPAGHRSLQSFYHGRGDCAFTESERVVLLLDDVAARPELVYTGRRASAGHPFQNAHPRNPRSHQAVVYYNTPHVSLGSLQYLPEAGKMSVSYNSRPRFFSVMFAEKPEQVLRTRLSDADLQAGARSYDYTADRVVQHRDWLIAAGELSASHGLTSRRQGQWDLYRVGRGLCAHRELPGGWHVFQVSDLDRFRDEQAFVSALREPEIRDGHALGASLNSDRIRVNLQTMAIQINGVERPPLTRMLHDSPFMSSEFGSGRITIRTRQGQVTFDNSALKYESAPLPELVTGHARWGNSRSDGETTTLTHVRAMGGLSPRDRDCLLKSVSILIPHNRDASARVAVYAGGSLEKGPHADSPARLLFDFGLTPKGKTGWLTLTHPTGVSIPAGTPVWIAWKGSSDGASVMYFENEPVRDQFQPDRGRWDSQAISHRPDAPWPPTWPARDTGGFDTARYSCFLTLTTAQ